MFKVKVIDLGRIKQRTSVSMIFPFEDIFNISEVKVSCGCLTFDINYKKKHIAVTYKTKPIPVHLQQQGQYSTLKNMTITFSETKSPTEYIVEVLTIKATIIK